jgi:hypothetical protein
MNLKKMFLFGNVLSSPTALISSATDVSQKKLAVIAVQLLLAISAATRFSWLISESSRKDSDFCHIYFS